MEKLVFRGKKIKKRGKKNRGAKPQIRALPPPPSRTNPEAPVNQTKAAENPQFLSINKLRHEKSGD